jgi:COMPASS component SWD3
MSQPKPTNTDAILGGHTPQIANDVVLGGLEGIKQRLSSGADEIQLSALQEALTYREQGLELLIEIWKNDSYKLKWKAFSLLRDREEETVSHAIVEYNPWLNLSCINTWELDSIAECIAISPDGNTLFSGHEKQINAWDLQTMQQKSNLFPYEEATTITVTPGGTHLIARGGYVSTISGDGHNYVPNTEANEELIRNSQERRPYSDFNNISAISYGLVIDREVGEDLILSSQEVENIIANSQNVLTTIIYHNSIRGIISWDIETGDYHSIVSEYSTPSSTFAISPCERFIVYNDWNSSVRVCNSKTGKRVKNNLSNSRYSEHSLVISNDGKTVAAGGKDANVKVWDFKTRELIMSFKHKDTVRSVAISSDNRTIVSGSSDGTVKVWDLLTRKIRFTLKGHKYWVYSVVISPDGNYIFSCSSDKTIRVWDIHTGKCVNTITGHTELIHALVVSPDGKTLISTSRDKTIKIWRRNN